MKIFVSYSSRNRPAVKSLISDLESMAHEVWYDQQLSGGQKWWDQILRQIRACELFVFALSGDAIRSGPCKLEYTYAYELKKPIVPVMLSDDVTISLLPVILQERQFVNYVNQDKAALLALNETLRNIAPAPPLPDPLPDPPGVPISPLAGVKSEIEQRQLPYERQVYLFHEIKTYVDNPDFRDDALMLLKELEQHPGLLAAVFKEINTFLSDVEPGRGRPEQQPYESGASEVPNTMSEPTAGMATLVVQRPSEWTARFRRYGIFIDGHKIGDVGNDDEVAFPIAPGTHTVHVSLDWVKSEPKTFSVQPDDSVRFTVRWQLGLMGGRPVLER